MADPTLADVLQMEGNKFGPLTPEQQAMLDRDKINESLGPFDFMPGMGAAGGAAIGSPVAAYIASRIPSRFAQNALGWGRNPMADAGRDLMFSGAAVGVPAAIGHASDLRGRYLARSERERLMMLGNPADAEGQAGGFYGQPKR
tara:strand:- start:470 stop:901 length:432 start_codon:yes stop_codon:yes gene_type:complete